MERVAPKGAGDVCCRTSAPASPTPDKELVSAFRELAIGCESVYDMHSMVRNTRKAEKAAMRFLERFNVSEKTHEDKGSVSGVDG